VTSPREGEGKTTVATNLAAAAATTGARVLLLETDMRRPALVERLALEPGAGLADVLRGNVTAEDAIAETADGFDVLPAGAASDADAALLQRPAAEELLAWAQDAYDLVIVDTSPIGAVADALPLLSRVDGVILATFLDLSDEGQVRRVRWQISEMGGDVLGVVVSNARNTAAYGYGPRPAATA
jgi:capsular exopolysaccharide synthesis family protein